MIKALDTAAMGMLKAQKRATELAGDILKTTTGQPLEPGNGKNHTKVASGAQTHGATQTNPLIQQISDFKLTELQFRASAFAFKRIAESAEVSLGLLVDKKG